MVCKDVSFTTNAMLRVAYLVASQQEDEYVAYPEHERTISRGHAETYP